MVLTLAIILLYLLIGVLIAWVVIENGYEDEDEAVFIGALWVVVVPPVLLILIITGLVKGLRYIIKKFKNEK